MIAPFVRQARIEERLGFRPQHNFDEWLKELGSHPQERAPDVSPWW
jgi:hypothetical protein